MLQLVFVSVAVVWSLIGTRARKPEAEAAAKRRNALIDLQGSELPENLKSPDLRRRFDSVDRFGNGYLDFDQTKAFLYDINGGADSEGVHVGQVCTFFGQLDTNNKGALSYHEIMHGLVWAQNDPKLKDLIPKTFRVPKRSAAPAPRSPTPRPTQSMAATQAAKHVSL